MPNHAKSHKITQYHWHFPPKKKLFFQGLVFGLTGLFLSPPHRKKTWLRKRNAYELCMICPSPALPSVFSGSASNGKGKIFYLICSHLIEGQVLVRSHLVQFPLCIQKFVGPLVFHKGQKYPWKKDPPQQRQTSLFGPDNKWGKGFFADGKNGKM